MKLTPIFQQLNNPDTYVNHFEDIKVKAQQTKEIKSNNFPIDIFPNSVQQIINATNESLNFPIDFISASMLFSASIAIGNTHKIEVKKGYDQNAVIYLAIVGRPGTNKSHPLTFALQPIIDHDKHTYNQYDKQRKEYETLINLTKKEREQQGYDNPEKPIWNKYLVSDFTIEALTDVHKFNKRGIGVYVDELASWFKNFNRYNNGSEQEFWLSNFSGKSVNIDRKTGEPTLIPLPFISVAGTIQNGLINELAKNRTENGFIDRVLFVVPENLKKPYWSEIEIDTSVIENWNNIITNLLNLPVRNDENNNPQPILLQFTNEAKSKLFEWQRKITDISNKPENEAISGIYAKMEMYAIRFSLILELMHFASGESNKQSVGIESVKGAIKLAEYFTGSALKVNSIVSNTNPLDKLPINKLKVYNALPHNFLTNDGIQVAKEIGMPERTFKYFISDRELFDSIKRGEYEKRF